MAIPDQAQADAIVAAFPTTPDPDEVHLAPLGPHRLAAAGFFFSPTAGQLVPPPPPSSHAPARLTLP